MAEAFLQLSAQDRRDGYRQWLARSACRRRLRHRCRQQQDHHREAFDAAQPALYDGQLWVLNSGTGHLGVVDPTSGRFEPHVFCPGFLRGLAFQDGHAIVGLSLPRDGSFAGLRLDEELKTRDAEPWCGVQIIELNSGNIVQWIRLEGGVNELFDVCVLPGIRRPTATGVLSDEIQTLITFEVTPAAEKPARTNN